MVDLHVGDDRPAVGVVLPKGSKTRIMPPEATGRVKPGLFGRYATRARASRQDIQELVAGNMVQSEIVSAANRLQIFAKGDIES
jgi:hypothetical protein